MHEIKRAIQLAAEQHGVLTVEQARTAGLSRSTFTDLVHREGWRRLHHGVYALPGSNASLHRSATAALQAAGPGSVACRRTAAHLLGLLPEPAVIEIFLPSTSRTRGLRGVRSARTRTLRASDITEVDGVRTTTIPRTVIDLAAVLEPPELRAVLIDARQRRRLSLEAVERRLATIGPVRGKAAMRALLRDLHPEHCDSMLESRVRALIRAAGIELPMPSPWPVEAAGRTIRIDIAWPSRRVGVEVDGFAFHSTRAALDRDHRRANRLTLAGWRILRVGWDRIDIDPDSFLSELRLLLA